MTKFLNKFKKPCFWSIFVPFSQFWGQKVFFPENPAPSRTTSYRFLAPCQNLKKTNNTISRKRQVRRKDGRTDGRTDRHYFIGIFRLSPGVQYQGKGHARSTLCVCHM